MKKTKTRKTTKAESTPPTQTPMPVIVGVIGRLVEPDCDDLDEHFVRAWAAAPAIAQSFIDKTHWNLDTLNLHEFVNRSVQAEIEKARRAGKDKYSGHLAKAVDVLEDVHDDYLDSVGSAYKEPAFHCGLALGLYLLLNGTGGAR